MMRRVEGSEPQRGQLPSCLAEPNPKPHPLPKHGTEICAVEDHMLQFLR